MTAPWSPPALPDSLVLVGFGATNQAVAAALVARDHRVVATDDGPNEGTVAAAEALGVELVVGPDVTDLGRLLTGAGAVVPSPGLPDGHPVFVVAEDTGTLVLTELDLAARWDRRPIAAITGTDGKTTVTTLVTDMLVAAGVPAVAAGNNDLPLVTAIDDPAPEWFVVEASSFRLGRSQGWAPRVATWLNLAPDHLDVHATHERYEAAKARIWAAQGSDDVAIGNLDDPVVRRHLSQSAARQVGFSLDEPGATYRVDRPSEGPAALVGPHGAIVPVEELPRALPHDLANALAAAATASAAGVPDAVIASELRRERALPHRVEHVGHVGGIDWYDDSKATVPHATLAAVRGFDSVVLIAGGRNKGLDLRALTEAADHVRAVVAIGEAAWEIASAFEGVRPVDVVGSMEEAVTTAARRAEPGDVVLLSPACASFDWYPNYSARGEDFANRVHALQETS